MAGKIFVNYRRDDSAANALNVAQYLEREFGAGNVFIDIDRMRAGEHFPSVLKSKLSQCRIMIVVIGPSWLTLKDEHGRRRIDDPEDWVRMEITSALGLKKVAVIPILVGGASLPKKDELPDDLKPLLQQHVATLTTNGFKNEIAGLARDIHEQIGGMPHLVKFAASTAGMIAIGAVSYYAAITLGRDSHSRPSSAISEQEVKACAGISRKYGAFLQNVDALADMDVARDTTSTEADVLEARKAFKSAHAEIGENLGTLELVSDLDLRERAARLALDMQNLVNNATGLKDLGNESYRDLRAGVVADIGTLLTECQSRIGNAVGTR